MTREGLAGDMSLRLEPLQTAEAHAYWRVFLSGRTDLPTGDLQVHMDRFLALPPEEQRSHFSVKKDGRLIGTVRLGPAEISGFSMEPGSAAETATVLLKAMDLLRAGGATAIGAHFEDRYEPAFTSLGFRRVFARMRMEAPNKKSTPRAGMWAGSSKGIPASSCRMPPTWPSRGTGSSARSSSRIGWGRPSSRNSGWRRIVEVGGSVGPCWRRRWAVSQVVTNRGSRSM